MPFFNLLYCIQTLLSYLVGAATSARGSFFFLSRKAACLRFWLSKRLSSGEVVQWPIPSYSTVQSTYNRLYDIALCVHLKKNWWVEHIYIVFWHFKSFLVTHLILRSGAVLHLHLGCVSPTLKNKFGMLLCRRKKRKKKWGQEAGSWFKCAAGVILGNMGRPAICWDGASRWLRCEDNTANKLLLYIEAHFGKQWILMNQKF